MRITFTADCRNPRCQSKVTGSIRRPTDKKHHYVVKFRCAVCDTEWDRTAVVAVLRESKDSTEDDKSSQDGYEYVKV